MPYDPGQAQILRDALHGIPVTESRMFGGMTFMLNGHMVCGVHKGGAMFRIGPANHAFAATLPGVSPKVFGTKSMAGFVDCDDEALTDDRRRDQLLTMALTFVRSLPAKQSQ